MSLTSRLDAFQQRHRAAGFPLAVLYKFLDDQGNYLAALIAFYGIVSLFPLLLLLSTVLAFVLHGDPQLQQRVLTSAIGQFPVVGTQLKDPRGVQGSGVGLVVGILGTVYGGLGAAQAAQNAFNTAWGVPRNTRPNPLKARFRSILLLGVVGLSVLATTVLSAFGVSGGSVVGQAVGVLLILASIVLNAVVFVLGFRVATARDVTVREVLPGALVAAVAWQVLQSSGAIYVGHVVRNATDLNSVFAVVLGLIVWIYLEAVVVMFAVELNVVRTLHLYPRALLTPFTDDVTLTAADETTYRKSAQAQRHKSFERIDVTFDPPES